MKKNLLMLLFSVLVVLQSCERGVGPDVPNESDYFDFATTEVAKVKVDYNTNVGGNYRVDFAIFDQNPILYQDVDGENVPVGFNEKKMPLHRGYTNSDGLYIGKMVLPLKTKEVYIVSYTAGVPQVVTAPVENGSVNFSLSNATRTKADGYDYNTAPTGWYVPGNWNILGKPEYLLPWEEVDASILYYISQNFKEYKRVSDEILTEGSDGVVDVWSTVTEIEPETEVELSLTFLHSGANLYNSVGYYTYDKNNPPRSVEDLNILLAFPNVSFSENLGYPFFAKGDLVPGDNVQLLYYDAENDTYSEKFPEGTMLGFVLLSEGFQKSTAVIKEEAFFKQYSTTAFNKSGQTQVIAQYMEDFGGYIIGMEDRDRSGVTDHDFNDAMFFIEVVDVTPPPTPDPDPYAITYAGVLAFEDLWPRKGDYDMNDLVMEYVTEMWYNGDNELTHIITEYLPMHTGASYRNAFGVQLGFTPEQIEAVIIERSNIDIPAVFQHDAKGLEVGQNELATFILFDNMNKVMANNGVAIAEIYLNEVIPAEYIPDLAFPPHNSFIVNEVYVPGRREVHMPYYAPTELASPQYFGREDDLSTTIGWYVSDANYPWAIHIPYEIEMVEIEEEEYAVVIPVGFKIPKEAKTIDTSYPKFTNWVSTNGVDDADWYLYPSW